MPEDPVKIEVYLDDQKEPIGIYRPPASFELDTKKLPDGPHRLIVKATDPNGVQGIREVPFIVRNGPGIAIVGLSTGDIVEGKIPVLVNAYAGTTEREWEPMRAETPAPVPTWAWVLFMSIVAWAMWYWARSWSPPPEYANTPTFASAATINAAAPQAPQPEVPTAAAAPDWATIGAEVYAARCAVCHLASGQGLPQFVPPLKASPMVTAESATAEIRTILAGVRKPSPAGQKWRGEMPGFASLLSDAQVAAVVNYERTNWGNTAPTVTPDQVKAVREQTARR